MYTIYGLFLEDDPTIRYVGITSVDISKRMKNHVSETYKRNHRCPKCAWIKHHGISKIKYVVIAQCNDPSDAGRVEQFWIKALQTCKADYPSGLNLTLGGDGIIGLHTWTDERRQHYSESQTGAKRSEQARENIRTGALRRYTNEEEREASRQRALTQFESQESRTLHSQRMNEAWTAEARTNASEAAKLRFTDPIKRQAHQDAMKREGVKRRGDSEYADKSRQAFRIASHVRWHVKRQISNENCEFCT